MQTPFDSLIYCGLMAHAMNSRLPPMVKWVALILTDAEPKPGSPRPPEALLPKLDPGTFMPKPRRFVGLFKLDPKAAEEGKQAWRDALIENGPGLYERYEFTDEACTKFAGFPTVGLMDIGEEDIEALKVSQPGPPPQLSEEEITALELKVLKGDLAAIELVFDVLSARGQWKRMKAIADKAMVAIDKDPGLWDTYEPWKRMLRNASRRLMSLHNAADWHDTGRNGTLYSTVDRGEWSNERPCDACGKKPTLASDVSFAARLLCPDCTRKPRSELPPPKPLPSVFSMFSSFTKLNEGEVIKPPKPGPSQAIPTFKSLKKRKKRH